MDIQEFMANVKAGKGLSEELQDEIAKEQLEDFMNLSMKRERWLEERKKRNRSALMQLLY